MAIIGENTQNWFYRRLYGGKGMLQTVTLLKRKDDQAQGTVTSHVLYRVRWSMRFHSGESLLGEMAAGDSVRLHIPNVRLKAIGVHYINALDRFVDRSGRTWQPESNQVITVKLIETHTCVDCLLVSGRELHG